MNVALVFLGVLAAASVAGAAPHPGSRSPCADCHTYGGGGPAEAPRVIPPPPTVLEKLAGKKSYQGHATVRCAGTITAEGKVTGCHRIENGGPGYLVKKLDRRPSDELCGLCHPGQRRVGGHHPTYKADRNRDGVAEAIVRPASSQQVYSTFAPSLRPEPLKSHPDALSFLEREDGSRLLQSVLPLQTVVEVVKKKRVTEANVLTCTTCHNPHFGYLVEVGAEEPLDPDKVARTKGDALLRLRDYTNALCEACH